MAFIADIVFFKLRFLRRLAIHRRLVERAMMDQDRRLDLGHILRLGRSAIEGRGRRQIRAHQDRQGVGHAAAKAEAGGADFPGAIRSAPSASRAAARKSCVLLALSILANSRPPL